MKTHDRLAARIDRFFRTGAGRHLFRLVPYVPPRLILSSMPRLYEPGSGGSGTGLLEVRVTGRGAGSWTLDIRPSELVVHPGPAARLPDARIVVDSKTWTRVASGRTSGTEAFMRGKLAIEGQLALVMKLDACFG